MSEKEATARIKINKLLEAAGWRFSPEGDQPANIRLEPSITIKSTDLDALGDNFEKTSQPGTDYQFREEDSGHPRPRLGRRESGKMNEEV